MLSSNTSAVSGDTVYIEDVFSTYLFTGTGSATAINNGIDLSTKGGLVWIKDRNSGAMGHALFDTARGGAYKLQSQSTGAQSSYNNIVFGTTGFTNDTQSDNNNSGTLYASWTFRKQPKFFDVVTYMGNGTAGRTVAHSLGSVPGCIIVKRTDSSGFDWAVYHRSLSASGLPARFCSIFLNQTSAAGQYSTFWNETDPTSTDFTVGTSSSVNTNGATYVAYIFAHNAGGFGLTGTDNVISCGSFTTDSGGNATVNLGYEPQWILAKRSISPGGNWLTLDTMRGLSQTGTANLFPNTSGAETSSVPGSFIPTATGFSVNANAQVGGSDTWIYIAIRRGPMKVPTDGTKVYQTSSRSSTAPAWTSNFPADWFFQRTTGVDNWAVLSRLTGTDQLRFNTTDAANEATEFKFDRMDGVNGSLYNASNDRGWMMKRAPSFFDEVCYQWNGTATRDVEHNLGVAPEMYIVKRRNAADTWMVRHKDFFGTNNSIILNSTAAADATGVFTTAGTTSTTFPVANDSSVNASGGTYVAYLFATCAGVSKVGSVTLAGSTVNVDCGFTAGARFVMLKRTSGAGDWYVFDTARGINAGNDPYLRLNSTAAEANVADVVDAYSAGFTVNGAEWDAGDYIYLAIA